MVSVSRVRVAAHCGTGTRYIHSGVGFPLVVAPWEPLPGLQDLGLQLEGDI